MKLAFGVSYCGKNYYGWQKQAHSDNTVQYHVERALSQVADHSVELVCAGRTDSGVHATGQVIHIETHANRPLRGWQMGVNTQLPRDIRINWAMEVPDDFHARFSATARRYHYIIEDSSIGNAIFTGLIASYRYSLDSEKMHEAAQYLLGENDFSSFRAAQCQSNRPFRHIDFINVSRQGSYVVIDIQANAFLYHMVRNIVGALVEVGRGKQSPEYLAALLAAKDRTVAPPTFIADGLYLVEVVYDSVYNIPRIEKALPFLSP